MQDLLSWGLVIATEQREQAIYTCMELAVQQTRKPAEIIIVDASRYWKETRERIINEFATHHPDIRWIYTTADYRSLPQQRNQAIRLATADVLFLFDTNLWMYPTCAAEIMRVYEADAEKVVSGVQASLVKVPPLSAAQSLPSLAAMEQVEQMAKRPTWNQRWHRIRAFVGSLYPALRQQLSSWHDLQLLKAPNLPTGEIPAAIHHLNVRPIRSFDAYRMTYRRQVLLEERFEPLLMADAIAEGSQADYPTSRQGVLVEAVDAPVYRFPQRRSQAMRSSVSATVKVLT